MTRKITEKKKDRWLSKLGRCWDIYHSVYAEIVMCRVADDQIAALANLTCQLAEASEEIDRLEIL